MTKKLNLILASTRNLGIGKSNDLPWPRMTKDMTFFKKMTSQTQNKQKQNALIMGSNTFESLNRKTLPGRISIVLTSRKSHFEKNLQNPEDLGSKLFFCENMEQALDLSESLNQVESRFIIGGAKVYNNVFERSEDLGLDNLFWTRVFAEFECDTFLDKEAFEHTMKMFKHKRASKTMVQNGEINFDFVQMTKQRTDPHK
jgi:dihydrofolate reductase